MPFLVTSYLISLIFEDICCVNTTMVFCIYAKRKGQLRSVIQNIREEEESYRTERGGKVIPTHIFQE